MGFIPRMRGNEQMEKRTRVFLETRDVAIGFWLQCFIYHRVCPGCVSFITPIEEKMKMKKNSVRESKKSYLGTGYLTKRASWGRSPGVVAQFIPPGPLLVPSWSLHRENVPGGHEDPQHESYLVNLCCTWNHHEFQTFINYVTSIFQPNLIQWNFHVPRGRSSCLREFFFHPFLFQV